MSRYLFDRTLIIGLGLIGGSLAKALKTKQLSEKIFACDNDAETLDLARSQDIIDGGEIDLDFMEDELANFDLIVLATPISQYQDIADQLDSKIKKDAIVIDLGSIKELNAKEEMIPESLWSNFVPCHPIAGSENSGFEYATADLFADKKFIVCMQWGEKPIKVNSRFQEKVIELITRIGAIPDVSLTAKKHDEIYALVSHLPQFISFLTAEFSPKNISDDFLKTAFRLDNSSPEIWEGEFGIFQLNADNLEKFYLIFFDNLERLVKKISEEKFSELLLELAAEQVAKEKSFNEKFFHENFSKIFFRLLVVVSYLKIREINQYQNYAGSGFKDFTAIAKLVNYDQTVLLNLLKRHQKEIIKLFKEIL